MKNIIRGLLAIAASGLALPITAEPTQHYTFDIERKSLEAMLTELEPTFMHALNVHFDNETDPRIRLIAAEEPFAEDARKREDVLPRVEELEEVLVTGSRLKQDRGHGPVTVTVFDSQEIERLGVSSIADVLRFLPQQPFSTDERFNAAGARAVQLRGLGLGATLVLINGRRTVTSAIQSFSNFFDLNTIPLSAVERVEVLSDSASAIYGADAVGGVVNIILKSAVERPSVSLYYGAADGGADERRASIDVGHSTQAFSGSVALDYFERGTLWGSRRDRSANQDYRRFGSIDLRYPFANPGNVCSLDGSALPGLSHPCAAVPGGSTGVGLSADDFGPTDGMTNLESLDRFISIVPESVRKSVTAVSTAKVSDSVGAFGEFLWSERHDTSTGWPALLPGNVVAAENPFNPFGVPVLTQYLFEGMEPAKSASEANSSRAVLGLQGAIRDWEWEVSGLHVSERATIRRTNDVNMGAVAEALATDDPATALNVFRDGPGGPPQLLAGLMASALLDRYSSRGDQVGAFVRGSLVSLPAGSIQAVLGAETREERIHFEANSNGIAVSTPDRRSKAVFTELSVPLVNADMQAPGVARLAATLAARVDDYSDSGSTINPQYSLEWSPVRSLLLRASYGTSYRAPALFELHQPRVTYESLPVFDPARGELALVSVITGGNPDLQPEESDSFSVGVAYTSEDPRALSARANFWRIEQERRVQRLGNVTAILANESYFPDRIVRAPSADPARPGQLIAFDATNLNFGRLKTSGVDVELSNSFITGKGELRAALAATWVAEFIASDFPSTPALDRVAVANISGTIPEWRSVLSLSWARGPLSMSIAHRYIPGYDDTYFNVPNGRRVGAQSLVDLQVGLNVDHLAPSSPWFAGITMRGGLSNVFDEQPEYSEIRASGYDPSLGDLRQRFAYVTVTKAW